MANLKATTKVEDIETVREEEFSQEETQNQLRTKEEDFIAGMLEAAD